MLQNLHTHTTFCDGKNTPEEILEKAIELGFDSIGFSSHAKSSFNTNWELRATAEEYVTYINNLKSLYSGKIEIFLGAELDYYSKGIMPTDSLDYTIGSVHRTVCSGVCVDYDKSAESTENSINNIYGGNSLEYARGFYERVVAMSKEFDYDVVGHFDLLTKFSQKHPALIDTESSKYKNLALEALRAVRETKEFFEVNTGAISRGYRTEPYPAPFILEEMRELDCKLVLTSDCHNKDYLDAHFDCAKEYVKSHGFDTLYYLTKEGFKGEKI